MAREKKDEEVKEEKEVKKSEVKSGLDMDYKLKGLYAPTKSIAVTATLREALGALEDDTNTNSVENNSL